MADNPGKGEQAVSAVPKSSPEEQDARLQNIEREVDLLKSSIKRLLMDIRERMNETDNPFVVASVPGGRGSAPELKGSPKGIEEPKNAGLSGKETARNIQQAPMNVIQEKAEVERPIAPAPASPQTYPAQPPVYPNQSPVYPAQMPPPMGIDRRIVDDQLVAQYKAQASGVRGAPQNSFPGYSEKFRLQKVYKLFKWTSQAVRKYGHDRLEIILQSYKAMGYISKDSFEEIKEVAKLMPASLGDEHEVVPDEYVSELYMLNRIIAPDDISLDRDMIELMMEQRSQAAPLAEAMPPPVATPPPVPRIEFPSMPAKEKKPAKNTEMEEDWMNLPDRI